jgi:vancomycin resistance protein YoaR
MKNHNDKTNLIVISITSIAITITLVVLASVLNITYNNVQNTFITAKTASVADYVTPISFTLTYKDKAYTFDLQKQYTTSNIHTILDYEYKHNLDTIDYDTILNTINLLEGKNTPIKDIINYIFVGFDSNLMNIKKELEYSPIDSTITFNPKSTPLFTITNDCTGIKIDSDLLYQNILESIKICPYFTMEIPLITLMPKVTYNDNLALTHKISSFTTNVSDSTGGRKTNVKLALSKLNGLCVMPNESISFNKLTGPHTIDTGYKPATVILNGEYTEDIGGGICQASSTLYNALLLTGTKITKVSKHSIPVKYVPLALDAMVSEGIADLCFTNTLKSPMYIHTYSNSDSVTVDIYSKALPDNITYKTRSETIKTIDFDKDTIIPDTNHEYTNHILYKGEYYRTKYPRCGYEAVGYLEKYQNNVKISEEKIRHEIYKPQNGVVVEGTYTPAEGMTIKNNIKIYT